MASIRHAVGVGGRGTIFRVSPGFTVMHAFSGADGDTPTGTMILSTAN